MSTQTQSMPVLLDADAIEALPLQPLGSLPGVHHRVLWADESSSAGVMTIDAGHHLGTHVHETHHHHMWLVSGSARILESELGVGSYVHIPMGVDHDVDARQSDGCTFLYLYLDQSRTTEPEVSP